MLGVRLEAAGHPAARHPGSARARARETALPVAAAAADGARSSAAPGGTRTARAIAAADGTVAAAATSDADATK